MKPWIIVKPRFDEAQWPPLSAKVSFVRIDPADLKLPGNNQSMSNWVFFVSSYILVLRFYCFKSKTPSLLHGQKWAFGGRITDVLLFTSNLWPNQWSHRLLLGTKWKIWTLSFHWYPLVYCRLSGLDTTTSQSQVFFPMHSNAENQPISLSC